MTLLRRLVGAFAALVVAGAPVRVMAEMPWPASSGQPNPYSYEAYMHASPTIDCNVAQPPTTQVNDLSCSDWQLTGKVDPNAPHTAQELGGVLGPGVDTAWDVTTGRPDVAIAVLDSGISWDDPAAMTQLKDKVALNWAELPAPESTGGGSNCSLPGVPP